jgi:hypothetical protein
MEVAQSMAPDSFNLNRLNNADKALDDWKKNRGKGPQSPWGVIIALAIILAVLASILHHAL